MITTSHLCLLLWPCCHCETPESSSFICILGEMEHNQVAISTALGTVQYAVVAYVENRSLRRAKSIPLPWHPFLLCCELYFLAISSGSLGRIPGHCFVYIRPLFHSTAPDKLQWPQSSTIPEVDRERQRKLLNWVGWNILQCFNVMLWLKTVYFKL